LFFLKGTSDQGTDFACQGRLDSRVSLILPKADA
jgi:hypothetical protein